MPDRIEHQREETQPVAVTGRDVTRISTTPREILLATAGKTGSTSAIATAHALARRHGAAVHVVSVFQPPIPYPSSPQDVQSPAIAASDQPAADAQLEDVRQQLTAAGQSCIEWPLSVEAGHPAWCISRAATRSAADLIVVGIGRADPAARPHGDRTVLGIAIRSAVPLLAVAPGFSATPRRVLIAVGLDESGVHAAQVAGTLLPAAEKVYLVHVHPVHRDSADAAGQEYHDDPNVERQFALVRRALAAPPDVRVQTKTLEGDAVRELLAFAREEGIDLIVVGLHGQTADERIHIRNTVLQMLSAADCSVLVVPQPSLRAD